jgi:hypothetical protein
MCFWKPILQERIRIGKELLEAKRIEEQNERKRFVFVCLYSSVVFHRTRTLCSIWSYVSPFGMVL